MTIEKSDAKKKLYSIGQVSKICNISQKTLRYYDKIGLIRPDAVDESNSYRYYSRETLLFVPVIKYYKQMGFKLDEMQELMSGSSYSEHVKKFNEKILELQRQKQEIEIAQTSVRDWRNLIIEAQHVIENNACEVSIKFMEAVQGCYMEQEFDGNYMESIINIDWTNYLESINTSITGAVMVYFEDYKAKINGEKCMMKIFQKVTGESENYPVMEAGGMMVASCYHIGCYDAVNDTYKKIQSWADANGYECLDFSIERYVTDFWTTKKYDEFVSEIIIGIKRKDANH